MKNQKRITVFVLGTTIGCLAAMYYAGSQLAQEATAEINTTSVVETTSATEATSATTTNPPKQVTAWTLRFEKGEIQLKAADVPYYGTVQMLDTHVTYATSLQDGRTVLFEFAMEDYAPQLRTELQWSGHVARLVHHVPRDVTFLSRSR